MKLDVYQEKYHSDQAKLEAGKIGFSGIGNALTGENIKVLGDSLLKATNSALEQRDALNSARIEADTMLAADKMYREFQETANPEDFEGDMTRQQQSIQNLIAQNSKKFLLPQSQLTFKEKMTRSLEEAYIGKTLHYSYTLQEEHAKQLGQEAFDSYKAQLLSGSTFVTVHDVMNSMGDYYTELARRYHIPQDKLDQELRSQYTSLIKSYAVGMIDKDPEVVRKLLVGEDFQKYKAYKESIGEGFSMEEFWTNDDLRKEYQASEFGARWTDISQYLDYDTRVDLFEMATREKDRKEKEAIKQKILQNAVSSGNADIKKEAIINQLKLDGTMPTDMKGPSQVDMNDDPRLGSVGKSLPIGEISYGKLDKGNSFTQQAKDFAGTIAGDIAQQGYRVKLTSSLRPGDTGSKHVDGSAVDLVPTIKGQITPQACIAAYKSAIKNHSNNMRKKATLFELPEAQVRYIKAQLEAEGVDTSYVNWEQSISYGKIAEGPHIHFGIDKAADYTKSNAGSGSVLKFKTQFGKLRYMAEAAEGKDPQTCYEKARKDEIDILSVQQGKAYLNRLITTKNAAGQNIDPSEWGKYLVQYEREITGSKKMTDDDRIIHTAAISWLQGEIPRLQKLWQEDPTSFLLETRQANTSEEASILQSKAYGVATNKVTVMTDAEAKLKAAELMRMPAKQQVDFVKRKDITPVTLKQIAKHISDKSHSNLLMYAAMADESMSAQFIAAIEAWPEVSKATSTNAKMFPTNWRAEILGEFSKNPVMKAYLSDVNRTAPAEATKMLDAMASLYAYRVFNGGTDKKAIVKDIVNGLVGTNFNSAKIDSGRFGSYNVNIAKNYNTYKVGRVASVYVNIGVSPNFMQATEVPAADGSKTSKEIQRQAQINRKHETDVMTRTAKLSSLPDGTGMMFTYENPRGDSQGPAILQRGTGKPIQISNRELEEVYNEAYKIKESWKIIHSTRYPQGTYILPAGKYARPAATFEYNYGTEANPYTTRSEQNAMTAAIEYVLTTRYKYLNTTEYTNIPKPNTDTRPQMRAAKPKSKAQPAKSHSNSSVTGFAADIYGFDYKGNIDLFDRPQVRNEDGSISTVRSMSYSAEINGKTKYVLIPTISNEGEEMDAKTAIKYWKAKKQHLGIYNSQKEANAAAKQIHKQQESFYLGE